MKRWMLSILIIGVVGTLATVAPAGAGTCWGQTDNRATSIDLEAETLYVRDYPGAWGMFPRATIVEVWREVNGLEGLQRAEGSCTNGTTLPADLRHIDFAIPDPSRIS